jgi:hypothetical protein
VPETLIGPLVSLWDVEQGVLATLRTWLDAYLAEVERQHGIRPRTLERPPAPESYHGGTSEAISWSDAELPAVIVIVEPEGEPEVSASVGYVQGFEVQVWCVALGKDGVEQFLPEESARMQVSLYGAAVMLLVQQGALEIPNLQWSRMVGVPRVECPEPDKRRQQASITTFHVWVAPVVNQLDGPTGLTPSESPGYTGPEEPFEDRPVAKDGDVDVIAEPTATPL